MINKSCVVFLLMSSLAAAQGTTPGKQKPESEQAPLPSAPSARAAEAQSAEVPPGTVVITINGVCEKQPPSGSPCKTEVTRAQLETLIAALAPGRPLPSAQRRRQFAMQYARLLTAAIEAEKQNLEKNPETQELVRFSRMQALAQELSRKLLQDAQPGAEQTQKYYQDNASQFEEITLRRILLPASSKNVTKDEMKQFAEQLQKRAAAGEDFDKLQKEGYEKAGMQNPPSTTVVLRVQNLTPEEEAAAKLKPGEVSQVISQPTTSLIYKLAQRKPIPFDKVKPEIEATLRQQNYQAEVEKLLNSSPPTLSDAYFGAEPGQAVEGPNQDTNGKQEHEPGAPQRKPSEAPRK